MVHEILHFIACCFLIVEESSRAGGQTYSVGEGLKGGRLFRFLRQCPIDITVQVTRSKIYF
jgi:hypothetical protein